jgi:hypothetical protein
MVSTSLSFEFTNHLCPFVWLKFHLSQFDSIIAHFYKITQNVSKQLFYDIGGRSHYQSSI